MNREIKYKAYHRSLEEILNVYVISQLVEANGYAKQSKGWYGNNNQVLFSLDEVELLQYTSKKAHSEKEIYEFDILREEIENVNEVDGMAALDCNYFLVVWINEFAGFCLLSGDEYEDYKENGIENFDIPLRETYRMDETESYFLCGNLFENPDLLK